MRVKGNTGRREFVVSGDGRGVVSRAGLALVAEVADALGVVQALAEAVDRARPGAEHRPGRVLADVALTLADGGDRIRHVEVLRGQPALFGRVASPATITRTLKALADEDAVEATVAALDRARAGIRGRAWQAGALPAPVAAVREGGHGGPLCLDIDPTLVEAHSDHKDGAAATYKRTWGFHPMLAYLDRGDGTGEALAGRLRPGNATANDTEDLIGIFDAAWANLPPLPEGLEVLVRSDSAGAVKQFAAHLRGCGAWFSIGMRLTATVRHAVHQAHGDDPGRWVAAVTQDGQVRSDAHVAEITDLVDLSGWPTGSRLVARREPLHPGAQQTFDDIDGYRFTGFLTDQPMADVAELDRRHRAHARVEDRIRCGKDTGLDAMPLDTFARNQIWLQLVLLAQDLLTFTQRLTLDGELAVAEPKVLRYKLLHVAARIVRTGRRWHLKLQHDWPWVDALVAAFARARLLPVPAD